MSDTMSQNVVLLASMIRFLAQVLEQIQKQLQEQLLVQLQALLREQDRKRARDSIPKAPKLEPDTRCPDDIPELVI